MNCLILDGQKLAERAKAGKVTRASLLGAYYYLYNTEREADACEHRRRWQSFANLFSDFKAGADRYLGASGYQSLDSRNLFDLLMTFSVYARINS